MSFGQMPTLTLYDTANPLRDLEDYVITPTLPDAYDNNQDDSQFPPLPDAYDDDHDDFQFSSLDPPPVLERQQAVHHTSHQPNDTLRKVHLILHDLEDTGDEVPDYIRTLTLQSVARDIESILPSITNITHRADLEICVKSLREISLNQSIPVSVYHAVIREVMATLID